MNNYMIDKSLRDWLYDMSIFDLSFGTPISSGGHDEDRVFILDNMSWLLTAPVNTQNWLHYKGKIDGVSCDHLFITQSAFYRALVNGLSHIPYECLMAGGEDAKEIFGDPNIHLRTYRAMKCYRGLLRKDIKQATIFFNSNSLSKLKKKRRFIIDGIELICYVLFGDKAQYVERTGSYIDFHEDSIFLTDAMIIHNWLQDKMNDMYEDRRLPSHSDDWKYGRKCGNSIILPLHENQSDIENRNKVIELFFKDL